jgi:two-component system response regulator RegA
MPEMEGLACLAKLILLAPKAAIIILTGYGSIATAMEAVRLGAKDYLTKPTDVARILEILQRDDILDGGEIRADPEPPTLERVEWEHIQRILTDCDGNISEAARLLGMHRRSLQRKLQKYPPTR